MTDRGLVAMAMWIAWGVATAAMAIAAAISRSDLDNAGIFGAISGIVIGVTTYQIFKFAPAEKREEPPKSPGGAV